MEETALDFSEVHTFLEIVDAGSYSVAADRLQTTKSSVSRRISRLESRLGVRLFARTTRSLSLTEEGAAFHERVAEPMKQLREAAHAVRDLSGPPRGLLRMTAPSDLPMIGALAAAFAEEFPEIRLHLHLTQRSVDLVREGYDLALRAGPLAESGLVSTPLTFGKVILCASATYLDARGTPRVPEALVHHDCVTFNAPTLQQRWRLVGPEGETELAISGRINSDSFYVGLDLALADAGVVMVPQILARAEIERGRLRHVLPDFDVPIGVLHVVHPGGPHVPRKVRVFVQFAQRWTQLNLSRD